MRYFYTLIVTAFLAVSANAQSVISEVDWTQETNYPLDMFCTGYGEPFYYISDEGLVINSNPAEGAEYWNPQVPMIGHIPELKKGEDYLVKFRIIAPAAGEIRLDLCSWDGSGAYSPVLINVEAGEKEYVVDFPDYPTDCTDALIYYQCGHLPGKHVIKTVQVFMMKEDTVSVNQVWTEGTTWDVEYTEASQQPHTLFQLMAPVFLDSIDYYPLTATTAELYDTIAYIRSEGCDEMVYVRIYDSASGHLDPECLLYDFTKLFTYNDTIRYGNLYALAEVAYEKIDQADGTLEYCYDILEDGDILPIWNGIIYKVGYVGGPIELFMQQIPEAREKRPKPTNVSHIIFGTKKRGSRLIWTAGTSINAISVPETESPIYNLLGQKLNKRPANGLYIQNGKVRLAK